MCVQILLSGMMLWSRIIDELSNEFSWVISNSKRFLVKHFLHFYSPEESYSLCDILQRVMPHKSMDCKFVYHKQSNSRVVLLETFLQIKTLQLKYYQPVAQQSECHADKEIMLDHLLRILFPECILPSNEEINGSQVPIYIHIFLCVCMKQFWHKCKELFTMVASERQP